MYDLLIDIPAVNVIFIKINGDENGLKQNYFVFLLNQTRSGHHMNNYKQNKTCVAKQILQIESSICK